MEKGNVYSLLGHNGSGKTSTINMLSGMTNVTFGDAFLFGFDCQTEISSIRTRMGVATQFDHLYPLISGMQ